MGGVSSSVAARQNVADPSFIQELELGAGKEVIASRVVTSRDIVLTPKDSVPVGKAVKVLTTESISVYGDLVRVDGTISAPGRTIRIFCRRLEFHPGADGESGIVVSGETGKDGTAQNQAATTGKDGGTHPADIPALPNTARQGHDGDNGADGEPGSQGNAGGAIEIYCETFVALCKVALRADGGLGGNGASGQQAGAGGHGLSGFINQFEQAWSTGGQGGLGGHGGDGGMGGKGGSIRLWALEYVLSGKQNPVTISAIGGPGGNGGQAGKGGKGGNGGTAAPETFAWVNNAPLNITYRPYYPDQFVYLDGGRAGGGGICGVPGFGGATGPMGTAYLGLPINVKPGSEGKPYFRFHWDWLFAPGTVEETRLLASLLESAMVVIPDKPIRGNDGAPFANPDECGVAGVPGKASELNRGDKARFNGIPQQCGIYPGKDGGLAPNQTARKPKERPQPKYDPPKITDHQRIGYKELAREADLEHLKMVFEQTRTSCLLLSAETGGESRKRILETLMWLTFITEDLDKDAAEARRQQSAALNASALGTLNNVRQGWNLFGESPEFAAFGVLDDYKKDLTTMLELFLPVEDAYRKLSQSLLDTKEQSTYLGNVIGQQKNLAGKLRKAEKELAARIKEAEAAISALESARHDLSSTLETRLSSLQTKIDKKVGLSAADFCNLFTQLSFTSVESGNHPGGGELLEGFGFRAAAMIASQAGDMIAKAIETVPSDTGVSVNRNYVIRRIQSLGKDVKTLAGFKTARDGLIKTDPSSEYRLQATREQIEAVCSNFYSQYSDAMEVSDTLNEYIEAVAARNEKISEYNQLLSEVAYVRGEAQKVKADQTEAETALRTAISPGLPAMAGFASGLRRHSLERCIQQLYVASRVYTMQALDAYDVFADVLGKLASKGAPGELDSSALNTALIDIIAKSLEEKQKRRTTQVDFKPEGNHCTITLTPQKHALLFKMLKEGKMGTFQILPAGPKTSIDSNPFGGKAEVRIRKIRCTAKGVTTGDGVVTIHLTHPGIATYYREDGASIHVHHKPITTPCGYNANSPATAAFVALDRDHRTIGPFCQWLIDFPKTANGSSLNLTALESITVEFEGTCRAFPPTSGPVG